MDTTVPWAPAVLLALPIVAALITGVVEQRRRRPRSSGWKAPGW